MNVRLTSANRILIATLTALTFLSAWLPGESLVNAQEVRKALNDYRNERPFQYQPSDPWTRSKLFQYHTKHYGLFYNCDNEECKRQSPYICWKVHQERDFPTWMTWKQRIRHEANQVRQRVLDGAGMCAAGCGCSNCQSEAAAPTCSCANCQAKANAAPTNMEQPMVTDQQPERTISPNRFVVKPATAEYRKSGLIGSNVASTQTQTARTQQVRSQVGQTVAQPTRKPVARVSDVQSASPPPANTNLLDRIRKMRR